jgi:hypothetical protein
LVIVETGHAESAVRNAATASSTAARGRYEDAQRCLVDTGISRTALSADIAACVVWSDENRLAIAALALEELVESRRRGRSWTLSIQRNRNCIRRSWLWVD